MKRDFSGLNDVDMLARIIEAEAASEPLKGKVAVGAVIDNRRKTGAYGNGWRGVITAPGQFSAINDVTGYARGQGANSLFWKEPSRESIAVAQRIISGAYRDPTGGATHYYNPTIANPDWARGKKFAPIGNHVFGRADAGRRGTRVADSGQTATDAMSALEAEILNSYASKGPKAPSFKSLEEEILNAYSRPQQAAPPTPEQQPAEQPREGVSFGNALDSLTQGMALGFGDELTAAESAVLGRTPGGGWFDYSKPIGERYSTALAAERGQQEQFSEDHPYVDAGLKIAGGVGSAVAAAPAMPIKAAATLPGRGAQVIAGGAVGGGATGFGEGEGGVGPRLMKAGVNAGIGAVAAPLLGLPAAKLAQVAGKTFGPVIGSMFTKPQLFDQSTGQLTAAGRRVLESRGLNPDTVSADLARQFGRQADEAVAPALASRFGVPLTKGQATGDVSQVAFEESARAGTRGDSAYKAMTGFDERQNAAVKSARKGVEETVGGRAAGLTPQDAAGGVIEGVRREAENARQAAKQVYERLDESGAAIRGPHLAALEETIANGMRRAGVMVDDGTPNARSMLQMIGTRLGDAEKGSVPFSQVERTRQQLVRFKGAAAKGSNGQDEIAAAEVLDSFDAWLETSVDRAIGDLGEGLDIAKEARSLWSAYRNIYFGKDGPDNVIRKIVESDLSEDQVASWLIGASRKIGGGATSKVADRVRNILGPDSEEWNAVRAAAWNRITKNPSGDQPGPQAASQAIFEALDGKGKSLSAILYSPQERQIMREFANMLKVLTPPKKATNPSGSGYQAERAVQAAWDAVATMIGFSQGGPGGAVAGKVAASGMREFSAGMRAKAAARGITGAPPSLGAAIGGAAAASEPISDAGAYVISNR